MRRLTTTDIVAGIISLLVLIAALWVALKGPVTPIPLHFDANGQADGYGSRYELAGVLAGMGLLNLVVAAFTGHQAAQQSDPVRRKGLLRGQLTSAVIIAGVAGFVCWTSLGPDALKGTTDMVAGAVFTSLILIAVGAMLGRVSPNPFIGVRTPWAFKSRLAWDKSNRLAGRLMFWLGVVGLISAPLVPQSLGIMMLVGGVLIAAAWSVWESWRVWSTDPERQPF